MTEWTKIAAAILACEASCQPQEMVMKSRPGKTPATREGVAAPRSPEWRVRLIAGIRTFF